MKTADFFYHLPPESIAQRPAEPRDSARMMVLRRSDGSIAHDIFRNIGAYLNPGDCLILNDTKVLPARLYGIKEDSGARVEFLLLNQIEEDSAASGIPPRCFAPAPQGGHPDEAEACAGCAQAQRGRTETEQLSVCQDAPLGGPVRSTEGVMRSIEGPETERLSVCQDAPLGGPVRSTEGVMQSTWECLAGPGKKAKPGARFAFGKDMRGEVLEALPNGNRIVKFAHEGSFYEILERIGEMPLPHYITEKPDDPSRYNTVYAREEGSAAAPTAGLHFTPALLETLQGQGIGIGYVTLHVGLGTFRPVKAEHIERHEMHAEHYHVPEATASLINKAKALGNRVICVGTTSCRTLEAVMQTHGAIVPSEGWTDIFIYPGYEFQCADALLTNFHLPESTLIMLVSAFYGREKTLAAYETAVREGYRFYSFGDCMLIL